MTRAEATAAIAFVTLGCGRNEVDSDQLAGSLAAAGYAITDDVSSAAAVVVNTCTFIAPAREESIEVVLDVCGEVGARPEAQDGPLPVLVVGCMAERYGAELRDALPEVAGVVSFADYGRLPQLVDGILGRPGAPARSLPLAGAQAVPAPTASTGPAAPPTAAFPVRTVPRGAWAYLKLASGCDRVCTFCSIPSFRGRFASRPTAELVAEASWLVANGVRELVCVSENTTSWGKDLGGRALQVELLQHLDAIEGLERVRLMYLQPAEIQPALLDAMAATGVVAPYYDLSLQHASEPVLSRMARSGSPERFLELIASIRARDPGAALRSSFIVGFPGETEEDVAVLEAFLHAAQLDWAGVFAFSAEAGTPAATFDGQLPAHEIEARRRHIADLVEILVEEASAARIGSDVDVLVERRGAFGGIGRSEHQAPETDGEVLVPGCETPVGRVVRGRIIEANGVDLVAEPTGPGGRWA